MSIVERALKSPYTVVSMLILITLMGIGSATRMPIDIFPEINIPVVSGRMDIQRHERNGHPESHI